VDQFLIKIKHCLDKHNKKPRKVDIKRYKKVASIIIPIVKTDDEYNIIMTKRTKHLKNHSGEISFPGGSKDPEDPDLITTALRELREEIGIEEKHVKVLGSLQDEFSVSYFTVKPFVAFIENFEPLSLKLDPYEVEKVLIIPIKFFMDTRYQWKELWLRNEEKHINFFFNYNGYIIWGLSGRIIKIFTNAIKGCV